MKKLYFILLVLTTMSLFSVAQADQVNNRWTYKTEKDCKTSDAKVVLYVGVEEISPRIVYLRQGDKVCLIINAEETRVSLRIPKYPVFVTAQKNQSEMTYFKADKVGEFDIKCTGCADGREFPGAKIIVQSKTEFDKFQEEDYRKDSEKYRKQYPKDRRDESERFYRSR